MSPRWQGGPLARTAIGEAGPQQTGNVGYPDLGAFRHQVLRIGRPHVTATGPIRCCGSKHAPQRRLPRMSDARLSRHRVLHCPAGRRAWPGAPRRDLCVGGGAARPLCLRWRRRRAPRRAAGGGADRVIRLPHTRAGSWRTRYFRHRMIRAPTPRVHREAPGSAKPCLRRWRACHRVLLLVGPVPVVALPCVQLPRSSAGAEAVSVSSLHSGFAPLGRGIPRHRPVATATSAHFPHLESVQPPAVSVAGGRRRAPIVATATSAHFPRLG